MMGGYGSWCGLRPPAVGATPQKAILTQGSSYVGNAARASRKAKPLQVYQVKGVQAAK